MKKIVFLLISLVCCQITAAQRVCYSDGSITIEGDPMTWTLATDGTQYPWVTSRYQWGKTYYEADGEIVVNTERRQEGSDLVETYTFTNTSKRKVTLKNVGIYTPFNDNYPDAKTCMMLRCNTHINANGRGAWVNALRMNGVGPHLGLMVTEGEICNYDVWERGQKKGMSNFRGVFALCPPDMSLKPGQSYSLTWRIFTHQGSDFDEQLLKRGGTIVKSEKYVYAVGETAKVDFVSCKGTKSVSRKITVTGDMDIEYKGTHALLLGISGEKELIEKRVRFILDHQQMQDKSDPRYGAFMIFDNEGDSILTNAQGRSDLSEGRERLGMGICLAAYALNEKENENLLRSLERYAKFVREKLQYPDYRTKSNVNGGKNRGYNYAWIADFYFRMALLTGDAQYARDGYATLRSLYRQFGYGFYCIDYPVTTGLLALQQTGMDFERDMLLQDFKATADIFVKNGLNFPSFEVNYEQSIIAPAVQFLCEVYISTKEQKYLKAAQGMMPALEALCARQPNYHQYEIAIRHWDGYWFGKRQTYGDVYPHYWSAITAAAYHYYAKAVSQRGQSEARFNSAEREQTRPKVKTMGIQDYQRRAENIVRGNLSLFHEDGRATWAFVFPRQVNGEPAHYADAYANDQDWALLYYMLVNEKNIKCIN